MARTQTSAQPAPAHDRTAVVDDVQLLRAPLSSIAALCRKMLAECEDRPAEFSGRVEEIWHAAEAGLVIVDEQAPSLCGAPLSPETVRRLGGDLPHKILKVHYKCKELQRNDADGFGAFQDYLTNILESHQECLGAIRSLLSSRGGASVASAPAAAASATEPRPALPPAPASGCAAGACRILVVDDDVESRRRMDQLLRGLGHAVESANNGRDALEHLDKHSCDLVVLDLCMEGVDGATVLREMREDYALRTVPVIVVSAAQDAAAAIRCIELGADDFLTKPIDESLLRARVASCLDKGAMRRNDRLLHEELLRAKSRNEDLLYEMFPYTVAQELRTSGRVQPRGCDNVAVLFCDLVGFTSYCSGQGADVVVDHLDRLFAEFELAVEAAEVEKIKTIGDCFLITAGVLGRFANPVRSCLKCAEEMRRVAAESDPSWQVRIGIHVGPLVAGMVGRKQFAFDVWGDTVNTAARIQTAAEPGMIALSEPAWAQVFASCRGKSIGRKKLKGKSDMEVFRFDGFRQGR